VLLSDCEIVEWDHRVEYDQTSGTRLYEKIRITVNSMLVANASSEVDTTVDAASVYRLHRLQGLNATHEAAGYTWLMPDHWVSLHGKLMMPQSDFVLWMNSCSTDADSIVSPSIPQSANQQPTGRRILLAACGYAGASDYPSDFTGPAPDHAQIPGNNFTKNNDLVSIFDPFVNLNQSVNSKVYRKDVMDCNMGPKPMAIQIIPMVGSRAAKLQYTIEICRDCLWFFGDAVKYSNDLQKQIDKKGSSELNMPIMFNRWTLLDSMDDSGRVTHNIRGKLIVIDSRFKPNAMRLMAFPLAFPFARTMSRNYVVSEDGKTLAYDFQFTQAGAAPPWGVRDYSAQFSERWSPEIKGHTHGAVTVKVKGWYHRSTENPGVMVSEQTQKYVLLNQAIVILLSRIRGIVHKLNLKPGEIDANQTRDVQLLDMHVIEQIGVPELELRVLVKEGNDEGQMSDVWLRLEHMGEPFYTNLNQGDLTKIRAYDPKWWPIDNEWGRLLAWDDGQPDYLYPPLGHQTDWRPYADYAETPDYHDSRYQLPAKTKIPAAHNTKTKTVNNVTYDLTGQVDGSVYPAANFSNNNVAPPITTNPINQPDFTAVVSAQFNGAMIPVAKPPAPTGHASVFAPEHMSGFSYVTFETEVLSDSDTGVVGMPLSKPRFLAMRSGNGIAGGSGAYANPAETATPIRLFAGYGKRVVNVKADRIGAWPIIPYPSETLTKRADIGNNTEGGDVISVEYLVKKEIIDDAPQPSRTGNSVMYSTNMRLTYMSSRPWMPNSTQAGGGHLQGAEIFPLAANMILRNDAVTLAEMLPNNSRFAQGKLA